MLLKGENAKQYPNAPARGTDTSHEANITRSNQSYSHGMPGYKPEKNYK